MEKKSFIILAMIATITYFLATSTPNAAPVDPYLKWKIDYKVNLKGEEDAFRRQVFMKNLQKINQHNSKLGRTYQEEANKFAILTDQEFAQKYLNKFIPNQQKDIKIQQVKSQINGPTVDWVSYGAVSPVKDQGTACAATYGFSAVGAIEGISAIFYRTQMQYSTQQMVDCTKGYGNNGCLGGTMENCFNYIRQYGIVSQSVYPYRGVAGNCSVTGGSFKISGFIKISDCNTLANALTIRPISVAVDGNNFRFYQTGVFSNCGTNLSLAALLVGMNDFYWTVKNAWGVNWGEKGYIRLTRGNTCGICNVASYPLPV